MKRSPSDRELATVLLDHLVRSLFSLKAQQQITFEHLGYSPQDRFELSQVVGQQLFSQGIPPFSPEQIQHLVTKGDLQAILYVLLCGGTAEQLHKIGLERLIKRVSFIKNLRKIAKEYPDLFLQSFESDNVLYDHAMSDVPAIKRQYSSEIPRQHRWFFRSRRNSGRVGEQYHRRLPES